MVVAIVGIAVLALVIALVVIVAIEPGPPPQDVAVAYEGAWDNLDFDSLWDLSGDELRDGLGRRAFVDAKRSAYAGHDALGHLAGAVVVEHAEIGKSVAAVQTRLTLRDGTTAQNHVELAKRAGKWVVVEYRLRGGDVRDPGRSGAG